MAHRDSLRPNATLSQTLLGLKCNRNPTPYPNPSYLLTMSQSINTVFTFPHWQGHCSAFWCIPSPGTTCIACATNKYPQTAQSTKSTWNSYQSRKNSFSGLTTPYGPSAKIKRDGSNALTKDARLKSAQLDVSRIIFNFSIHVWERVLAYSSGWPWTDSSCFCLPIVIKSVRLHTSNCWGRFWVEYKRLMAYLHKSEISKLWPDPFKKLLSQWDSALYKPKWFKRLRIHLK